MGSRRVPRGVLGCFGASGLRDFGDATWRGTRSKLLNQKRVSPSLEASTASSLSQFLSDSGFGAQAMAPKDKERLDGPGAARKTRHCGVWAIALRCPCLCSPSVPIVGTRAAVACQSCTKTTCEVSWFVVVMLSIVVQPSAAFHTLRQHRFHHDRGSEPPAVMHDGAPEDVRVGFVSEMIARCF